MLMVDNYDSFTYNLVHLLEELGAEVLVRQSDAITPEWNLDGMVEDDVLAYRVGLDVVRRVDLPAWFHGDEFEAKRKAAAR